MDARIYSELQTEIVKDLTLELQNTTGFSPEILAVKVKNAIREVMVQRNYSATTYTEKQIYDDLRNYYSVIINVARYDYNQIGAEGEQSHSENGIARSYVKRDDLFKGVYAFVKVL